MPSLQVLLVWSPCPDSGGRVDHRQAGPAHPRAAGFRRAEAGRGAIRWTTRGWRLERFGQGLGKGKSLGGAEFHGTIGQSEPKRNMAEFQLCWSLKCTVASNRTLSAAYWLVVGVI